MRRTIWGLALVALAAACGQDDWGPDELLRGQSSATAKYLARGREGYALYCVGCHGEKGDGAGPAARFLEPKPRDFRVGRLKFTSVAANSLPTDDDYLRTIDHGLNGTAMPSWRLIPLDERRAIVAYIKTFFTGWDKEDRAAAIAIPADPWEKHPDKGVAEGERLYHGFAACFNCHPAYAPRAKIAEFAASYKMPVQGFRDGLYESVIKESDWGAPIMPPNFLVDRVKFSTTLDNLALVIAAGVGGTAMPSWGTSLTAEQLWGLTHYVQSLIAQRSSPAAAALRHSLDTQPAYQPPPSPDDKPPVDERTK